MLEFLNTASEVLWRSFGLLIEAGFCIVILLLFVCFIKSIWEGIFD